MVRPLKSSLTGGRPVMPNVRHFFAFPVITHTISGVPYDTSTPATFLGRLAPVGGG